MGVLATRLSIICSLFNIFVCCLSSLHSGFPSATGGNETDRLALLAIKAQINYDPHRFMSSWNESIHFCQWHGITCGHRHQRVTVLDLHSQQLVGSISPHIGNLSFLKEVRFQNNSFIHEIPPEIGHLHRLQILRLNNNSISGEIPANISSCSNIIYIDFSFNKLVGKIPTELGSLSKLQDFLLQRNNLTGEILPSFGNISSLESFAVSHNNFIGSIPNSLGRLTSLTILSLGFNRLSGTIPSSIYNLSAITVFNVPGNQIQGSLPSDLGNTFPNLKFFSIDANKFTGSIPVSISNASNIAVLGVSKNELTGQVPTLQKLHNLRRITIAINHLGSGEANDLSFLSDLTNATGLQSLYMNFNNFGGMLPTSICNFSTKFSEFNADTNQIYGRIPTGIGNLVNLGFMSLGNNQFTGNIPTDIGMLQKLVRLSFKNNKLSGNIPSSLGNLKMLTVLYLGGNNLQGSIPSSLGKCKSLLQLDLSQNNLSGAIPQQVIGLSSLISLDLSVNHLTGSLPMEVGNLRSVGVLDVSNNMLYGEIPNSLGSCESLEFLLLQGNFFQGTIPSSLMSLRGIQYLDLSHNNLSCEIPQYLEGFKFLQNLNLSFNDFGGAVPVGGVFKNASATSIVGNNKLCGGMPELQLPRCNFEKSKKRKLTRAWKLIISTVSGILGITLVLSFLFLCLLRKKRKEPAASSSSGNSILQVSYTSLLKATDAFSSANLIGVGSFGSVYKGILGHDGSTIAVKVFNLLRQGASKSFIAECEALRNIRHRNLVKIITACSSVDFHGNDFKALIYEFMVNGSLEEWLHPITGIEEACETPRNFNLLQRLNITIDVARALEYLHHRCQTPIVHCDIKPSNVLLDNEMTGHVADFGLARFLSKVTNNSSANQTSSIGIRGTVGYTAPEYGMGSKVSTYGDMYSYGILLMEMFTGKRPTDNMFNDSLNLHNFVKMALPERVTEIADSVLLQGGEEGETSTRTNNTPNQHYSVRTHKIKKCLTLIFRIGIACSVELPGEQMNITAVITELHSVRNILLGIGVRGDRPTTSTI